MGERKSTLPCIICGKQLLREMDDYELQPRDAVMCSTRGNYGSTVFDPLNGEHLHFNICDPCLVNAGDQGRIATTPHAIPVWTDTPFDDRSMPANDRHRRPRRTFRYCSFYLLPPDNSRSS